MSELDMLVKIFPLEDLVRTERLIRQKMAKERTKENYQQLVRLKTLELQLTTAIAIKKIHEIGGDSQAYSAG